MPNLYNPLRDAIVTWLRLNGQTISSFDRIIANVPGAATYSQLQVIVAENPNFFRNAKIRGGMPGLVLLPATPTVTPEGEVVLSTDDMTAPTQLELPNIDPPEVVPSVPTVGDSAMIDGVEHILAFVPVTPPVPKTASENVEALIAMAVEATNSNIAVNYANAAFLAAQAFGVLTAAKSL